MAITQVHVVIPARNEEHRIGRCLDAMRTARQQLTAQRPQVVSDVMVVLDGCTDTTAEVVARFPEVRTVRCDLGRVGAVRALGASTAITAEVPPAQVWLACTDADSAVPPDWLVVHVEAAESGVDLVLGTVRPLVPPQRLLEWSAVHDLSDGHGHVHGANLGVRGDIYLQAGGFVSVTEHEDVLLTERIRRLGGVIRATAAAPVATSARTVGRTAGGFARWMFEFTQERERLDTAGQTS